MTSAVNGSSSLFFLFFTRDLPFDMDLQFPVGIQFQDELLFKPGGNVYRDSGGGALSGNNTKDPVSLDSRDLLALELGYGDLFLCESAGYREVEHENDKQYFFHSDLFYNETLKGDEKLQALVL